ncbi:MAG TPA: (d)CMP kinase, partial [Opitutales bacterium]|nr:(d)CMP kinase [Opitutales bacterium]
MSNTFITIAVDGGAAAGKSSTSRALAARFNLLHVDTGMHYRALTWSLLEAGVSLEDEATISRFLETQIHLETEIHEHSTFIRLNGQAPTAECLRSEQVNTYVSKVASWPCVRTFLLDYQRSLANLAQKNNYPGLIMEGRDIGSVIFPHADFKFFLSAHADARAARRALEGIGQDSITQRDAADSSRKAAPLICPEGALAVDSSHMTLAQVIDLISAHIVTRLPLAVSLKQ